MRFSEVETSDITAVNEMMAACEYDGYVLTGSTDDAHDSADFVLNLIKHVQELHARHAKIIGICYGHQVWHSLWWWLSVFSSAYVPVEVCDVVNPS